MRYIEEQAPECDARDGAPSVCYGYMSEAFFGWYGGNESRAVHAEEPGSGTGRITSTSTGYSCCTASLVPQLMWSKKLQQLSVGIRVSHGLHVRQRSACGSTGS